MSDDEELGPEYRAEYPMNIVITNAMFRCTKCREWKAASHFGLRCTQDGVVRNQPQCMSCRGKKPYLRRVK